MYPGVIQIGAPVGLSLLGFRTQPSVAGHYSQFGQDRLICEEILPALDAVGFGRLFLDVGCNEPILHSNSYYFEKSLGFDVLAIDALVEIKRRWAEERPRAEVIVTAVGETIGQVSFDVVSDSTRNSMFSSVSGASNKASVSKHESRTVDVRPLTDILAERHIDRVAIMSMDIEGYELPALKGIDFSSTQFGAMIIENNGQSGLGSDELRDFLSRRGYVYHARIWNFDDVFLHESVAELVGQSR